MQRAVQRNIQLLGWFNFLLDFRLYAAIKFIYFEHITGSYLLSLSLLSVMMVASALLELPTGIFSDWVGRRKTVMLGAVASLAAAVLYAAGSVYWVLAVGAIFEGLERALFSGNNDALLHDTLTEMGTPQEYQTHLGRVTASRHIAFAISATIGGLLAAISFSLAMWFTVLPRVGMLFLTLLFVEPKIDAEKSDHLWAHLKEAVRHFIENPRLRFLNLGLITIFAIGEATFQFRTVFIEMLWPLWATGLARAYPSVMATGSFYFAGSLIKRFGERRLLFAGITISETINMVGLYLASFLSPFIMGTTSIFFGVNTVSMNGMMQREFTDAQRSTMGSLTALGGSLCVAGLALLVGWLADTIGVRQALMVVTLFNVVPLGLFWLAFRRRSTQVQTAVR